MPSRPVTHLGVVSPRQDIVCHFGTQVCDQLTRTGKREAEHGRDVGEDVAFVSVRPSEEADEKHKKVNKESTVVEEVDSACGNFFASTFPIFIHPKPVLANIIRF